MQETNLTVVRSVGNRLAGRLSTMNISLHILERNLSNVNFVGNHLIIAVLSVNTGAARCEIHQENISVHTGTYILTDTSNVTDSVFAIFQKWFEQSN